MRAAVAARSGRAPAPLQHGGAMSRHRVACAVALALLAGPGFAGTTAWEVDPAHTSVQFAVRHLMISNVRGEFRTVAGSFTHDADDATRSTLVATIDPASLDTREPKRDDHLRSPDFLDVARYPTMTFRSTRIEPAGERRWRVTGDLTLHGVTRPIVLDVSGPTAEIRDPFGKIRAGAQATTTINRKDFGITWNKALDGGGVLVGEEIAVTIDVEVTKQAPAAAGGSGAP
jgi:polyisoprenoid-binding protein YceI